MLDLTDSSLHGRDCVSPCQGSSERQSPLIRYVSHCAKLNKECWTTKMYDCCRQTYRLFSSLTKAIPAKDNMMVVYHHQTRVESERVQEKKTQHTDSEANTSLSTSWSQPQTGHTSVVANWSGQGSTLTLLLHVQWLSAKTIDRVCPVPSSPGLSGATCGLWQLAISFQVLCKNSVSEVTWREV